MGRLFTAGSSHRIQVGSTGLAGFDFRFGTIAACLNFTALPAAGTIMASNATSGASFDFYQSAAELHWYDVSNDRSASMALATATTYIIAATKATGSATPTFHKYVFSTNAWTHTAGSGTNVDSAANTSVTIGSFQDAAAADALDATVFAIGAWSGYVMSNAEVERLVNPNWGRFNPTMWDFWDTSRDNSDMSSTLGRYLVKQTARTGAARGTVAPPPGWGSTPVRHRR